MHTRRFFTILGVGALGAVLGAASTFALPGHAGVQSLPVAAAGEDDQQRIVEAVKRVEPSVVALEVTIHGTRVMPANPFGNMFGFGFGPSLGSIQGNRVVPYQERASGSGFVYSKDGLIVTNDHVVHGASAVTVVFADGRRQTGKVYAENGAADLALVKVNAGPKLPPPVSFAAPQSVQQGAWAIAIGEPYALRDTVTLGVVSGFNRSESIGNASVGTVRTFKGLMQTSAPINPGNSGGPLIDLNGDVIGVNQSVERPAEGIGFAIPVSTVQRTVALLAAHPGEHDVADTRGFLGVTLGSLSSDVRAQIGNYRGNGVVVLSVVGGSPADQAGLQPGDVIQSVNGKSVTTPDALASIVHDLGPGKKASLHVWSNGTRKLVAVTIGNTPDVAMQ